MSVPIIHWVRCAATESHRVHRRVGWWSFFKGVRRPAEPVDLVLHLVEVQTGVLSVDLIDLRWGRDRVAAALLPTFQPPFLRVVDGCLRTDPILKIEEVASVRDVSCLTASLACETGPIGAEAAERVWFPSVRRVRHAPARESVRSADLRDSRDHVSLHVALDQFWWVVVVTIGGTLCAVVRCEAVDAMATAREIPIERFYFASLDNHLCEFIHLEVERKHADPFALESILVRLV
jgi:hypothetical protein